MNPHSATSQIHPKTRAALGALLGAALGLPLLALAQVGAALADLPSPASAAFELVTRLLPGALVTTGIEFIVGALQGLQVADTAATAKAIEGGLSWLLMLGWLGLLGAIFGWLGRALSRKAVRGGLAAGLTLWLALALLGRWAGWNGGGLLWICALSVAWGLALAWAMHRLARPSTESGDRRTFMIRFAAGLAAVAAWGLGLAWLLRRREGQTVAQTGERATPAPSGFEPVAGTRAELTPVPDFYRVDIKLDPPRLQAGEWRLALDGLVENPQQLALDDLRAMPGVEFYATLECISNNVGGDLISTTLFGGVPLAAVLERAGLRPEAQDLKFVCADGYTESLPLESAADPGSVLCYAMGGQPLTAEHGFPLRLFTPNRFGMKNPKWITRLEAVGEDYLGFWEQRDWSEAAWVKTTSVIDSASPTPEGRVQAGGIAYAGARGIERVDVRLDEGEWVAAELKPALSGLTWVLWRAELPASGGPRRLTVRAVDGEGKVQTERKSQPHPDGATGWHQVEVSG